MAMEAKATEPAAQVAVVVAMALVTVAAKATELAAQVAVAMAMANKGAVGVMVMAQAETTAAADT